MYQLPKQHGTIRDMPNPPVRQGKGRNGQKAKLRVGPRKHWLVLPRAI